MYKFILVGPNAGKTGKWGGYQFTNGVCILRTEHEVDCAMKILPSFYSAWPEEIAHYKQMEYYESQKNLALPDAPNAPPDAPDAPNAPPDAPNAPPDAPDAVGAPPESQKTKPENTVSGRSKAKNR